MKNFDQKLTILTKHHNIGLKLKKVIENKKIKFLKLIAVWRPIKKDHLQLPKQR